MLILPANQPPAPPGGGGGIVTDSLEVHLDARDGSSYSGSGQDWLDLENSYDFYLGSTSGADTSDPTFTSGSPDHFDCASDFFAQQAAYSGSILRTAGRNNVSCTLEWWIKPSVVTSRRFLGCTITSGGSNGVRIGIKMSSTNGLIGIEFNGGGTIYQSSTALTAGNWTQVALTILPDNAEVCTFYKDGSADGTYTANNSGFSSGDSAAIMTVGSYNSGTSDAFDGDITIFRAYSKILSAAEVLQNYDADKASHGLS